MKITPYFGLQKSVNVWFLGSLGYKPALRLQELVASCHFGKNGLPVSVEPNTILILEHQPVYTIGIRTSGYPLSEEERLKKLGADFNRTNRGGLITFHGPGQLVAYPIINLNDFTKSMKWYICKLEETVIRMCQSSFGIEAHRSIDTGVWVNSNKICAIGVHGSRYITTHGLALNCNVDLKWFSHIIPCGIRDKGVTSLSEVLGKPICVNDAINPFLLNFSQQFDVYLKPLPSSTIQKYVNILIREQLIDPQMEPSLLQNLY